MTKRVLISGASGFIGSNVLDYLLGHTDWEFVALCSWRHHGNPLNVDNDPRVEVVTHDLAGPIPFLGPFDYIMHLASESHVDRSITDPVPFVENNISITLQMLEYARLYTSPKAFLLFSTDEVFGAREHGEWDVLLPSNPYAASKAAQEMIAISYWKTYGVPIVITNSNNIVGPNQDPEKFVPKVIQKIRAGGLVQIHVDAHGQPGKRHYNSVRNVADALMFILQRTPQSYPGVERPSRYSLGGGQEIDNLEMFNLLVELLGGVGVSMKLVPAEGVRRGYDQFYPKTEGRLLSLGWKPVTTLEEELRRLCQ